MPAAYVFVKASTPAEPDLLERIRRLRGVTEAHFVYGVYDAIVKVEAETAAQLRETIMHGLRRIPQVSATYTTVVIS